LTTLFYLFLSLANAEPISDNSFLIEEAYNQEPGVIQFIQSYQYNKTDEANSSHSYSLTVEAPIKSEAHQISLTLTDLMSEISGVKKTGAGDSTLSYRYQLVSNDHVAVSPRLGIIFPTGKKDDNLGAGSTGIQFNFPVSVMLNKHVANHWNFGFTNVPNAKTVSTNFGSSLVWLFKDTLNFMLEFYHASNETASASGTKTRSESYYLNPGLRFAHNIGGTQLVPGISFPIGIAASEAEDYGFLLYFSIEGKAW
jgi:hypothetical protein